jgi:hypothetical protein
VLSILRRAKYIGIAMGAMALNGAMAYVVNTPADIRPGIIQNSHITTSSDPTLKLSWSKISGAIISMDNLNSYDPTSKAFGGVPMADGAGHIVWSPLGFGMFLPLSGGTMTGDILPSSTSVNIGASGFSFGNGWFTSLKANNFAVSSGSLSSLLSKNFLGTDSGGNIIGGTIPTTDASHALGWNGSAFTSVVIGGGAGGGTVTDVSGIAPINVATGTTTPVISITQADATHSGYLTSTDWNTFNSKGSGNGTVTSIGLTTPSWLSVGGSPITSSGTLALTAATGQTANKVLATPDGTTGAVGLRSLTYNDIPSPDVAHMGTGATSFTAGSLIGSHSSSSTGALRAITIGAGLTLSGSTLSANSLPTIARTAVTTSTYTVLTTDYLVSYTGTTGSVLTLPAATTAGKPFIIKDGGGNAGTNAITIQANGTDTIDGNVQIYIQQNYGSVMIVSTGSGKWEII